MNRKKAINKISFLAAGISILMLCSGCNLIELDKPEPEKTYYSFNAVKNQKKAFAGKSIPADLILLQFTAAPEFRGKKFIYKKNNKYIKDYYNRFFSPPEKMIQTICAKWLNKTGLFKTVSTRSQADSRDYILKCELLEIYCDITEKKKLCAIIKTRFTLMKYGAADKVIMEKEIYGTTGFHDFSPDNLINAWSQSLEEIFIKLLKVLHQGLL